MNSLESILSDLTPSQLEAVTHQDGPMLVVAGAGSGKTRVVTRRIAWLLSHGVWPSQILAMTFTNKAAREMRERIAALTGSEPPRSIGTFHSCCARFLRQDIGFLRDGRTSDFTIYDDGEQQAIVKQILKDHAEEFPAKLAPRTVLSLISAAKSARVTPEQYAAEHGADEALPRVATHYERKLRECNAVDFDDLLLLMARILEDFPDVRAAYQRRYRYLLIDEYQDTNHLQYELMRLLTGPEENVHVTGDPDQSIYSWRGADYSNIMNFTHDFPNARVVKLEQNYRSTQAILDAANEVISNNANRLEKRLFTENSTGFPVRVVRVPSGAYEGFYLTHRLRQLRADGVALRDIAVFYRTNSQSRPLEDALIQDSIPYQLLGGVRFYDRQEIRDLLAFLRLSVNPGDQLSLARAAGLTDLKVGPKTLATLAEAAAIAGQPILDFLATGNFKSLGIRGVPRVQRLAEWAAQLRAIPHQPLEQAVRDIYEFSRLEEIYAKEVDGDDRIANLEELISKAAQFGDNQPDATLADFLEEVALVADVDGHDPDADRITLMTLHSSKGLEFPYVFITGVEEGLLPHKNSLGDDSGIEEERRLFYVGITRAREELTLLHAESRYTWSGEEPSAPSRFLDELPRDGVKYQDYGMRSSRHGGGSFWRGRR